MKIYIAGPIVGTESGEAFRSAADKLAKSGYTAISPTRITTPYESHDSAMTIRLSELLRCDGVALLPGWSRSRDVRLELDVAFSCGKEVRWCESWVGDSNAESWEDIVATDANGEALE